MANNAFEILMDLTEAALEQEYKEYYGGYKGVLKNVGNGSSVRYADVQNQVLGIIEANRKIADQLNEYYDSDYGLANELIEYIREEIAA